MTKSNLPHSAPTINVAIHNGGDENDCPVYFQKRTCEHVDIGMPTAVLPGATLCAANLTNDQELVVWCGGQGAHCKISTKNVDHCP